ncbi:MAG: hypothetical protein F7C33_04140 [Desulfurococcales archaeon]|nr:hypothetical protein [Desulfurococcales archaeon]
MAARIIGKPREPSVGGMLVLSWIIGLLLAGSLDTIGVLLAIAGLLLNFFTFDATMDAMRARKAKRWLLLVALNSAPYVAGIAYWGSRVILPILVGLAVLSLHLVLAVRLGWKSPATYIFGASIPVLPELLTPALVSGSARIGAWIAWLLLTFYAVTTAAYVETRLAYRRMDPRVPLVTWLPSLTLVPLCPMLLVAMLEPWFKVASNLRGRRLVGDPQGIRRMGWIELSRLFLFAFLVALLARMYC